MAGQKDAASARGHPTGCVGWWWCSKAGFVAAQRSILLPAALWAVPGLLTSPPAPLWYLPSRVLMSPFLLLSSVCWGGIPFWTFLSPLYIQLQAGSESQNIDSSQQAHECSELCYGASKIVYLSSCSGFVFQFWNSNFVWLHCAFLCFWIFFFLFASVPRTHFRDSVLQILQIPLVFQKFVSLWQIMLAHPLSMN